MSATQAQATQNKPEHGTKRTVVQLVVYRPDVRFIGINRKGGAVRIHLMDIENPDLELEYDSNWDAWTARFPNGPWQQICVFEPQAEAE